MSNPARPNILFVLTDQQRPDAIGVSGHPCIRTPAMDRIANEGAYFPEACANAPVCMPSRHSLLSGLYPSVLGNTCNGIEMPTDVPLFHHDLGAAGYWTANIGKLHFLNHSNRDHTLPHPDYGFDRVEISDEPGCYDDAYIEWVRTRAPEHLDACRCSSPPVCVGPRLELEGREVDEPYAFRGPEDLTHSAFVADRTIQAIRDCPEDRPWFVVAGFYAPHCPLNPPQRLWDEYRAMEDLPLPAWPESMQPSAPGGPGPRGHTVEQWRDIVAAYLALTTHVDDQVGKLLDFLDAQGLAENTIVVFTSDHGEFLGDNGRIQKGPPGNDCIMRVPLAMRWPAGFQAGIRSDALVELVDLVPTLLDLAGVPISTRLSGLSLKPLLDGGETWPRRSGYQEFALGKSGWRTVRTKTHTYAVNNAGEEILWNRERDPHEFVNFATDPTEAETLAWFREEVEARTPVNRRPQRPRTGEY